VEKVEVIDKMTGEVKDFYKEFIEHLKKREDFKLENCIINGNVDILEVYERIKDDDELKELVSEKIRKDAIVDILEITVTINITINFQNVEFIGDFLMHNEKPYDEKSLGRIKGKAIINGINLTFSRFKGEVDFRHLTSKGKVNFTFVEFEKGDIKFSGAIFEEEANFDFIFSGLESKIYFVGSVFEKDVRFTFSISKGKVDFTGSKFKRNVDFSLTFEKNGGEIIFRNIEFNGDVDFSHLDINGTVKFEKVRFKSIAKFTDISFELLVFSEVIFEDIVVFSKKNPNKGIAIFNLVNFKNPDNTAFIDFPLSKTSFLMTDVKEIIIIAKAERIFDDLLLEFVDDVKKIVGIEENIEKEKVKQKMDLYHDVLPENENELNKMLEDYENQLNEAWENLINKIKQKIYFENDNLYDMFAEMCVYDISPYLLPYLKLETVLKEYRNIRKSFEKNRTYVEASELFIYEMDLIRRITVPNYEQYKILIYGIFSILLIIMCWFFGLYSAIILILLVILLWVFLYIIKHLGIIEYLLKVINCLKEFLEGLAFDVYKAVSNYGESLTKPIIITIFVILIIPCIITHSWNPFSDKTLLEQTLRAFFQLGIDNGAINSTTNSIQKEQLQTLASYEWLIRTISLILLGSLFIAIKRRLERK
jgi:hypothetical protein